MKRTSLIFDLNGVLFTPHTDLKSWLPLEEGVALLHACHRHPLEHELYVCSNMPQHHLESLHREHSAIMDLFTAIVTPTSAGAKKPSHEIFTYLLERYQIRPEESFFIDDSEVNISAAQALGMQGILVQDFSEVRRELERRGIL
jgi:putative hydrolase of the HAD superfamily